MKVPPASTYRSRMAVDVASSVAVPNSMAPRLSTLTPRRVSGVVPIVRYLIRIPLSSALFRSGAGEKSGFWSALQVNRLEPGPVDGGGLLDQVQVVAELVGRVQAGVLADRAGQQREPLQTPAHVLGAGHVPPGDVQVDRAGVRVHLAVQR